jgi:hypothetical protein
MQPDESLGEARPQAAMSSSERPLVSGRRRNTTPSPKRKGSGCDAHRPQLPESGGKAFASFASSDSSSEHSPLSSPHASSRNLARSPDNRTIRQPCCLLLNRTRGLHRLCDKLGKPDCHYRASILQRTHSLRPDACESVRMYWKLPLCSETSKLRRSYVNLANPWQHGTNENTNRLLRQYICPRKLICHCIPKRSWTR